MRGLKIDPGVYVNKNSVLEGGNYLAANSSLISSRMGYASYIGKNTELRKTWVGNYTCIGPDVKCIFGQHPSHTFVSQHPAFFSVRKQTGFTYVKEQLFEEFAHPSAEHPKYQIDIGHDVWIGAGVRILDGIKIGNGAIIASNALVVKDVEPFTIVGGVPAKPIKKRFTEEEIKYLQTLEWWNKDAKWLRKHSLFFANIKELMNNFPLDDHGSVE